MNAKQQVLNMLKTEFNRWDAVLSGLNEEQVIATQLDSGLTIKDEIAHLWAWQQRTSARTEAAATGREPGMPKWPEELNVESDDDVDQVNAWIYETNRAKTWEQVYGDWRSQYLRIIQLAEQIDEEDLLDPKRYPWLSGKTMAFILEASCSHHEEHYEPLVKRISQVRS
jgi:hypothetical protein